MYCSWSRVIDMFELTTFTVGGVLLGFVITLIAAIILLLCVSLLFGKRHTPISYAITILFTLVLLVLNITFIGLVNSKQKLEDYQNTYEYKLVQKGSDILGQISPNVAGFVSELLFTEEATINVDYQLSCITKYLWINGILCIVLFGCGVVLVNALAGKQHDRRSYTRTRGTTKRISSYDDF